MSLFGGADKVFKPIGEFNGDLLKSLSTAEKCSEVATALAAQCSNSDLMKICADRAKEVATSGPGMGIIIAIAVVLFICCCIYCCCSSSGVYYWNKQQTTKQETK